MARPRVAALDELLTSLEGHGHGSAPSAAAPASAHPPAVGSVTGLDGEGFLSPEAASELMDRLGDNFREAANPLLHRKAAPAADREAPRRTVERRVVQPGTSLMPDDDWRDWEDGLPEDWNPTAREMMAIMVGANVRGPGGRGRGRGAVPPGQPRPGPPPPDWDPHEQSTCELRRSAPGGRGRAAERPPGLRGLKPLGGGGRPRLDAKPRWERQAEQLGLLQPFAAASAGADTGEEAHGSPLEARPLKHGRCPEPFLCVVSCGPDDAWSDEFDIPR